MQFVKIVTVLDQIETISRNEIYYIGIIKNPFENSHSLFQGKK